MTKAELKKAKYWVKRLKSLKKPDIKMIVFLFNSFHFRSAAEARKTGLVLKEFVSKHEGSFRRVYQVESLKLVVKFPQGSCGRYSGIEHTNEEIDTFERISTYKKYKYLRHYLPKIYYYNRKTGVVLMKKYKLLDYKTAELASSILNKLAFDILGHSTDIYSSNVAVEYTKYGCPKVKIIDLGYFSHHSDGS